MMRSRVKKQRLFIFLIISWLVLRLKWTLELSRLTIFRLFPKTHSQMIPLRLSFIHPSEWFFDDNRSSCLTYDKVNNQFVIQILQPLSTN